MTSQDINLNNLYSELNKHEANEDYENTLTISDKSSFFTLLPHHI